uniref:ANK_REP_REGION domain-containing protein n=1 Tax=Macrostomum lignano TaxID=282301 RepID=A0A1I8IAF3_9PLAT
LAASLDAFRASSAAFLAASAASLAARSDASLAAFSAAWAAARLDASAAILASILDTRLATSSGLTLGCALQPPPVVGRFTEETSATLIRCGPVSDEGANVTDVMRGQDLHLGECQSKMWTAVESDDLPTVRKLINQWCRVDLAKGGMTLKDLALSRGTERIITLVIKMEPTLKFVNAVVDNRPEDVRRLFEKYSGSEIDVNFPNMLGRTALCYAFACTATELPTTPEAEQPQCTADSISNLLLDHGCSEFATDWSDRTAQSFRDAARSSPDSMSALLQFHRAGDYRQSTLAEPGAVWIAVVASKRGDEGPKGRFAACCCGRNLQPRRRQDCRSGGGDCGAEGGNAGLSSGGGAGINLSAVNLHRHVGDDSCDCDFCDSSSGRSQARVQLGSPREILLGLSHIPYGCVRFGPTINSLYVVRLAAEGLGAQPDGLPLCILRPLHRGQILQHRQSLGIPGSRIGSFASFIKIVAFLPQLGQRGALLLRSHNPSLLAELVRQFGLAQLPVLHREQAQLLGLHGELRHLARSHGFQAGLPEADLEAAAAVQGDWTLWMKSGIVKHSACAIWTLLRIGTKRADTYAYSHSCWVYGTMVLAPLVLAPLGLAPLAPWCWRPWCWRPWCWRPGAGAPGAGAPGWRPGWRPGAGAPGAGAPGAGAPGAGAPGAGALVLAPLVLAPLVLAPLVLAPLVLAPLVLAPWCWRPWCWRPGAGAPGAGAPGAGALVLKPLVLKPLVLAPLVLKPLVLKPLVLAPLVLKPLVLKPLVLKPLVLKPLVLKPLVLKPCLCEQKVRRVEGCPCCDITAADQLFPAVDAAMTSSASIAGRQVRYCMLRPPGHADLSAALKHRSGSGGGGGAHSRHRSDNGELQSVNNSIAGSAVPAGSPWVRMELSAGPASQRTSMTRAEQQDPLLIGEVASAPSVGAKHLSTTSLRGVPKIVKTKEKFLKVVWASFVLAFFLGCLTCLALIINQYLAHDVIHQPKTMRNYSVEFPSFTVCNTRPLSQAGIAYIRSHGLMLPKEYSQHYIRAIRNTARNMNGLKTELFNLTVKDALSTIFDTKGYYENMPAGIDMNQFGHALEQTILLCESTILMNSFKRSKICDSIGHWTQTYDNKFLNCYTFTADANHTKSILTVRIMAFTNERNLTYCPDCSNFPATQVSGLRVQLHNAGNYPEVQEEGLNIKPGSLTEIRFDTKQWMMKEPPHGRCSETVPPTLQFNGTNFTYSYQACKNKLLHEQIHRQCGCLDSTIPLPDSLQHSKADYCGRIPDPQFSLVKNATVLSNSLTSETRHRLAKFYGVQTDSIQLPSFISDAEFKAFLSRVTCNMEVFIKADEVTIDKCFTPCTFYSYDTTISTTNWPTKAYLYEFVNDFAAIKSRIESRQVRRSSASYLEPIYQDLKRLYEPVYRMAQTNQTEANRMLREIDYVQNNFIEILINRGKSNFDIERIEEKAVISLTSLLSQIGGLLSIWVGLTFVCIVEVIELLYNIVVINFPTEQLPFATLE